MTRWTDTLAPDETLIWTSNSFRTFSNHAANLRLVRTVQYFAPVCVAIAFAVRDVSPVIATVFIGLTAAAVYCFPRFESDARPWLSFAITSEGARFMTRGGVKEFIPWSGETAITISQPPSLWPAPLRPPARARIDWRKGAPNSKVMKWALARDDGLLLRHTLEERGLI